MSITKERQSFHIQSGPRMCPFQKVRISRGEDKEGGKKVLQDVGKVGGHLVFEVCVASEQQQQCVASEQQQTLVMATSLILRPSC